MPAIDAVFEVANKAVCGSLMLIYGYSPTIATVINFGAFVLCAIVFRWAYRREVFFRTVLLDALLDVFAPATSVRKPEIRVFPTRAVGVYSRPSPLSAGAHGIRLDAHPAADVSQ